MTAAQKTAKANFKKAIEYRKKTGVSLKEAFAHVYGRKVGAAPKKKAAKKAAPKKAAKKVVKKAAPKKAAPKKAAPKKVAKKKHTKYGVVKKHVRRVAGVKKKVSEQSVLNKIHKVKDQVNQLDELQHKHMVGYVNIHALYELDKSIQKSNKYKEIINNINKDLKNKPNMPSYEKKELRDTKKTFISLLKEQKIHIAQIKKHIK